MSLAIAGLAFFGHGRVEDVLHDVVDAVLIEVKQLAEPVRHRDLARVQTIRVRHDGDHAQRGFALLIEEELARGFFEQRVEP